MLDLGIPDVAELSKPAAISRAQVAAYPVVIETVVVGTGAERDATRTRWCRGEQLIAF